MDTHLRMQACCDQGFAEFEQGRRWAQEACVELEDKFRRIVEDCTPRPQDYTVRQQVIQRIDAVVRHGLNYEAGMFIVPYGSFVSHLFTPHGDLDLAIEGSKYPQSNPDAVPVEVSTLEKRDKASLLRALVSKMEKRGMISGKVERILHARVPIVKFTDKITGVDCDVSVGSSKGHFKSQALGYLCHVDPRFPSVVRLVKQWASAHRVIDASDGLFNTFALTNLVIFFLQKRTPAILPPMHILCNMDKHEVVARPLHDGMEPPPGSLDAIGQGVQAVRKANFGSANRETPMQLFSGFLVFLHNALQYWCESEMVSQPVRASVWSGDWVTAEWPKDYIVGVEDPFDFTDNCARSVHFARLDDLVATVRVSAQAMLHITSSRDVEKVVHFLFSGKVESPIIAGNARDPELPLGKQLNRLKVRGEGKGENARAEARRHAPLEFGPRDLPSGSRGAPHAELNTAPSPIGNGPIMFPPPASGTGPAARALHRTPHDGRNGFIHPLPLPNAGPPGWPPGLPPLPSQGVQPIFPPFHGLPNGNPPHITPEQGSGTSAGTGAGGSAASAQGGVSRAGSAGGADAASRHTSGPPLPPGLTPGSGPPGFDGSAVGYAALPRNVVVTDVRELENGFRRNGEEAGSQGVDFQTLLARGMRGEGPRLPPGPIYVSGDGSQHLVPNGVHADPGGGGDRGGQALTSAVENGAGLDAPKGKSGRGGQAPISAMENGMGPVAPKGKGGRGKGGKGGPRAASEREDPEQVPPAAPPRPPVVLIRPPGQGSGPAPGSGAQPVHSSKSPQVGAGGEASGIVGPKPTQAGAGGEGLPHVGAHTGAVAKSSSHGAGKGDADARGAVHSGPSRGSSRNARPRAQPVG